jgi:ABC-type transport system involved in cytochrome c biogenesis permease subunit
VLLACLTFREIRPALGVVLPLLQVLVLWLLTVTPVDGEAPVTYATVWLAVHVWLGKVFLGCIVVAVGIYLVVLARKSPHRLSFASMPANEALDELAYRLVLVAFIFESLMLVAGAIWAQDAWGRYWAWDPLESWAFITWVAVAGYLHFRVVRRPSPTVNALIVVGIFGIAFSTFFGMPFISTAPHKGAI